MGKARTEAIMPLRRGSDGRLGVEGAGIVNTEPIKDWSLTSLREKLIKVGAKLVRHGRYVAFQMADVAVTLSSASSFVYIYLKDRGVEPSLTMSNAVALFSLVTAIAVSALFDPIERFAINTARKISYKIMKTEDATIGSS